jgi:hypothetical protein
VNEEPTVLDFVKALLTPWKGAPPAIPPAKTDKDEYEPSPTTTELEPSDQFVSQQIEKPASVPEAAAAATSFPWRAGIAFGLALFAQLTLEPGEGRTWVYGLIIYIFAAAWVVWATLRGEWVIPALPEVKQKPDPQTIRPAYLWIGGAFSILAFLTLGNNRFTLVNLSLWLGAIIFIILAFWLPNPKSSIQFWPRFNQIFTHREWDIKISRWTLVLIFAGAVILFFRIFRLGSVPPEMVSDHAEKLLDVWDVLQGNTFIFFPRNTGREGLQMYLTAAVSQIQFKNWNDHLRVDHPSIHLFTWRGAGK